jgi:hypothetical protein
MHNSLPLRIVLILRTVDNNIYNRPNLRLTMLCVVEGLPSEDEVVEVLAHMVATMVVVAVAVVHETNFLHVNCVDLLIIPSSSATKGLI